VDVRLRSGAEIPAGTLVVLDMVAANTDPGVWGARAGEFDPDRALPEGVPPWGHSFGGGTHACIGMELDGGVHTTGTDDHEPVFGTVTLMLDALLRAGARPDPATRPCPTRTPAVARSPATRSSSARAPTPRGAPGPRPEGTTDRRAGRRARRPDHVRDAKDAYRAKDLRQSLYDEGEVIMADVLVNLHGDEHRARRRAENRMFRRDVFERYERELFPTSSRPRWPRTSPRAAPTSSRSATSSCSTSAALTAGSTARSARPRRRGGSTTT
jgi:hypothetical protein